MSTSTTSTNTTTTSRNTTTTNPFLKDTTAQKIIDMQTNIITNLRDLLTTESRIEGFTDINQGTSSIILNPQNYPNVSDYANVYNQNIALLDDPKNLINASFNTYLNIQEKKLANMRANLSDLQDGIQNSKISVRGIKGFKSMNNSQILNTERYDGPPSNNYNTTNPNTTNPNTTNTNTNTTNTNTTNSNTTNSNTTNPNTTKPNSRKPKNTNTINSNLQFNIANTYPNHLIYGNNGCLQYEETENTNTTDDYGNNIIIPASWAFRPCNANEPRQQFVSTQVNDLDTYNSFITDKNNLSSRLKAKETTTFGFNIVNPIGNQDQCLQLNSQGLSVMPCNLDFEQRFRPIYNTVMP